MRNWLPGISFFDDSAPHPAALNMAIDEALLSVIARPVLRVYRWVAPAVSFGYFEPWQPIRDAYPGRDAVRRWTGGGIVTHGEDFTYCLLIPASAALAVRAPGDTYGIIHSALCSALQQAGIPATPAASSAAKKSRACFENPVLHDVLVGPRKVAGAAQRRTRLGLIHQGSVQTLALPPEFGADFAARLAQTVRRETIDVTPAAENLVAEKYGTRPWLERR